MENAAASSEARPTNRSPARVRRWPRPPWRRTPNDQIDQARTELEHPAECPLRSGGARRGVADSGYVKRWSPKIVRVRPPRPPHNGRAVERATADGAHPRLRYNPPQPTRSPRRTPIHPQNGTTATQREPPRNRPSRNHTPNTTTPYSDHLQREPSPRSPSAHGPLGGRGEAGWCGSFVGVAGDRLWVW